MGQRENTGELEKEERKVSQGFKPITKVDHFFPLCDNMWNKLIDHGSYVFKVFGTNSHYHPQKIFLLLPFFTTLLAFTFLWQAFIREPEKVIAIIHLWSVKKKKPIILDKMLYLCYIKCHSSISTFHDLNWWISHHLKLRKREMYNMYKLLFLNSSIWHSNGFILYLIFWFAFEYDCLL